MAVDLLGDRAAGPPRGSVTRRFLAARPWMIGAILLRPEGDSDISIYKTAGSRVIGSHSLFALATQLGPAPVPRVQYATPECLLTGALQTR